MKFRIELCISMGDRVLYAVSLNQKWNNNSSAEAEPAGAPYVMSQILWYRYFTEAQGCDAEDVYMYQDNQSAILLENNGIKSVGKNSRHINIEYIFITDKVKDKESKMIYCPTKEMMADAFTKPLQWFLFTSHRNDVLGINVEDMLQYRRQYDKYMTERIGNNIV